MRAWSGLSVLGVGLQARQKYLAVAHTRRRCLSCGFLFETYIHFAPASRLATALGFCANMKEKVDPYYGRLLMPLDLMSGDQVERALTCCVMKIAPLAFMPAQR